MSSAKFHEMNGCHWLEVEMGSERQTTDIDILNDFMGTMDSSSLLSETDKQNYTEELRRYLDAVIEPANPFDFDLLDWWYKNRHNYKNLFKLFIAKAGICASSAPSERCFSTVGIIIEARRNCLLPKNVQNLIMARSQYLQFK